MVEEGATSHRRAPAILTEPFGVGRLVRALLPVWYAILVRPKAFFGGIAGASGPLLRNALGYLAITLAIYVAIQTVFEDVLIRVFQYEGPTFLAHYAVSYEAYGRPFAEVAAFFAILVFFAAVCAFQVVYFAASTWVFVRSYVHFGEIASFKSVIVATAYATSFVMLTFSLLSLPLIALSARDDPASPFYVLGPLTMSDSSQSRYELVLTYFYVRAISFTTGVMLHWGLVFTILAAYAVVWLGSVL